MIYESDNELIHHGIKGMRWGIRRYQNKDGSLTSLGKKRIKLFQNAADRANRGKQYADANYKRFTKLAEKEEAKKGKAVSKKQIDAYLKKQFGNDMDSKLGRETVKEIFEIDDLDSWAKEQLSGGDAEHYRNAARKSKAISEAYDRLNKKFSSMTVNDIKKKNLKQAKKFVNSYFGGYYELEELKAYKL